MSRLIGSWSFYKKTLMIAVPVMIQNLITNFVALIDNIMVGQVGTEQMSGVAIVNQIFFVYNLTIFGALSGAGIFCAQFFGKQDTEGVRHTFRFKLMTTLAIVVLGLCIFLFFGDNLITMYLHDAEEGIDLEATFGYAKQYMMIMLVGLVPFSFEQAYSTTLREGERATPPMVAGIAAVVTNTLLNYLLIFGIGPFPVLGVQGAAIATVISRFVQVAIVIIWTHTHSRNLPFVKGLYRSFRVPKELTMRIVTKGLIPLTANECLWSAGVSALVQCYSLRGIDVVAGLNISNTVVNLFNVMFIAFGSGVSVVIGQLLGASELEKAREAAPKLIFFSGAMCVVVGGIMACFSGLFPLAYNTSDNVRTLASSFILISAVLMPIHGILHCTYFTLRSGGKTFITFLFDCGFSWGISVPLAFCLANFTDMSIIPLYLCCQCVEAVKCIIGLVLIKKGVWLSNIVAVKE
ncbi:MAG: MATE family efflux transporter [Ruminiclostridium sp.]|nr:MATE family efflux transporter [Ruminiclostridium sp.]MBQ8825800.1 MATE family efflux transporter [Oscillospiraceae bacterium]